ncbi:hypothetical protein TrLO_g7946 [Triparma laevis f. longispina]|uniref:Uncharacterized protein n=1 Tax=Triparma laevis f. longispina TaxID=1714387 RepID=A0A9W7FJ04_9STRA|nr:hypothetical protein TrLO_g7946 [Triparma laevis f. longispina]
MKSVGPILVLLASWLCFSSSLTMPPIPSSTVAFTKESRKQHKPPAFDPSERIARERNRQLAMAIPGNGIMEQTFVGGFFTFLTIYNYVITFRILLSWFPQAQGISLLQPVFAVSDPFLNVFRGIVPSIGGLDLSPLLGFFLLNMLTNATAALGCPPASSTKPSTKLPATA